MSLKLIFCGPDHISRIQGLSLDLHILDVYLSRLQFVSEESRLGMLCKSTQQCFSLSKQCTILSRNKVDTHRNNVCHVSPLWLPRDPSRAMQPLLLRKGLLGWYF